MMRKMISTRSIVSRLMSQSANVKRWSQSSNVHTKGHTNWLLNSTKADLCSFHTVSIKSELHINNLLVKTCATHLSYRNFSDKKQNNQSSDSRNEKQTEKQSTPDDQIEKLKIEINEIENKIKQLKGNASSNNQNSKTIHIEGGKYDKQVDDDDEIIYRLAYDFPGFKLKNIKVMVINNILRIYAFQTSSKKDTKEYIYENTTEEILPNEVDVNKMSATFDAENGFLIVEAILSDDCDLKEITKRTAELNDKLFKLEKDLEAKKKQLSTIQV